MVLEIYTYGAGEIVQEILNAISSLVKPGSGYSQYLYLVAMLAGIMTCIQYISGRKFTTLIGSILRYAIVTTFLLLPAGEVKIIDEVSQTQNLNVSNVPLGLAIPAHFASTFFHGLTRLVETAFHMPDDLNYSKNGYMFASKLIQNSSGFVVLDQNNKKNIDSFVSQCVFYDIHFGKYSMDDLVNSNDIWKLITQNPSPIRMFMLDNKAVTCKGGAPELTRKLDNEINNAALRYASAMLPKSDLPNQQLKALLLSNLGVGYNYLNNLSASGSQIMQQLILSNAVRDNALNNPILSALSFADTKANANKFMGNITTGMLIAQWQPILAGVFECLLYSIFILVVFYALFADGVNAFKNYILSIAWVGSWPVVYAFLNLGATYSLRATSGGYSLSMADMSYVNQTNYYLSALFGYATIMVPYFSWQILKIGKEGMGAAMMQLSQLVGGASQSVAMAAAGEAASGNIGFGNTNFNNHSAFNTSGFKYDTNASFAGGNVSETLSSGTVLTEFLDGHTALNQSQGLSQLNTQIHLAESLRSSIGAQSDSSYSAALNDANNFNTSLDSSIRYMNDLATHFGVNESSGSNYGTNISSNISDSMNAMNQEIDRFAKSNNVSHDVATKALFAGYTNAHYDANWSSDEAIAGKLIQKVTGGSVSASGTLGARGEKDWSWGDTNSDILNKANEFSKTSSFGENFEAAQRAFAEESYRSGDEVGKRLSDSFGASLNEAKQQGHSLSAHYNEAQSYREFASATEDNAATIDMNASQNFMKWLATQPLHSGFGKMGAAQADSLLRNDPQLTQAYARQFTQEQTSNQLKNINSSIGGSENIQAAVSTYQQQLSKVDFKADYQRNTNEINNDAKAGGIKSSISTTAKNNAAAMNSGIKSYIESKKEKEVK